MFAQPEELVMVSQSSKFSGDFFSPARKPTVDEVFSGLSELIRCLSCNGWISLKQFSHISITHTMNFISSFNGWISYIETVISLKQISHISTWTFNPPTCECYSKCTSVCAPPCHSSNLISMILSRQFVCNTFSVYDTELTSLAAAIYTAPSFINHSCVPNCIVVFTGRKLSVRSTQEINAGDQLFISYTEQLQTYSDRKKELDRMYGFQCTCKRCRADEAITPVSVC